MHRDLECKVLESRKIEVVKQEMARMNTDIIEISELKWTGMSEFNSDDHCTYYCGKESLRRNGVGPIFNKRVQMQYLDSAVPKAILKLIESSQFICKQITQHHSNPSLFPNTEPEEAEVEQFCEDLQDFLELTPKKDVLFIIGDSNAKSRKSRDAWSNRQVWPWSTKRSIAKTNRILSREYTSHCKHPFPITSETILHMDNTKWSILKSD